GILEEDETLEERGSSSRGSTPFLNLAEWGPFVPTNRDLHPPYLRQPVEQLRLWRHHDAHRQGIDQETNHRFRTPARLATGPRGAEDDVLLADVVAEDNRPGS